MAYQSPGDQYMTIHGTINIYLVLKTSHWGLHKMADILETTFSNACLWLMIITFWLIFHYNLFLGVIDNISALVQVMAEAMPTKIHNIIWHHLATRNVYVYVYVCWMLTDYWDGLWSGKFLLDPRWLSRFVSGHSVCWRFGTRDPLGSNPAFSRGRQLVSFQLKIAFLCHSIKINNNKHVCINGTWNISSLCLLMAYHLMVLGHQQLQYKNKNQI